MPEARKRLKIKDPEQYSWHPKQLITQLAHIHLSLYRARSQEWVQVGAGPGCRKGSLHSDSAE